MELEMVSMARVEDLNSASGDASDLVLGRGMTIRFMPLVKLKPQIVCSISLP